MIGGGCTFLKLAQKVDDIKSTLANDEQRVSHHHHSPQVRTPLYTACTKAAGPHFQTRRRPPALQALLRYLLCISWM